MNKTIAIIGALAIGAASLNAQEQLSVSATVGWESEYVFRGESLAEEIFTPAIDVSMGGMYAGLWAALPSDRDADVKTELDLYAGYSMAVSELVSLDFGGTYYTYINDIQDVIDDNDDTADNSFEIYVGGAFDVMFSPSIYAYYDFDVENFTLESSAGYSWGLAEGLSLDLGVYLGWVMINDDENNKGRYVPEDDESEDLFVEGEDTYWYYGASLDLVYSFTDTASFSIGGRFGGSSEDTLVDEWRTMSMEDSKFWWGWSFTAGF